MTLNQLIKDATAISHKYTTGDIPLMIYGTEVDIVLTEQGDNGKYHIEVNCVPTPKEKPREIILCKFIKNYQELSRNYDRYETMEATAGRGDLPHK